MKTKFLQVLDTMTEMHFLVLQFEEVDRRFCEGAGFEPGLKVVLQFMGRIVTCFAGYNLQDELGQLSQEMPVDGTVLALKEILHHVHDIRMLPDTVNVEAFRCQSILLQRSAFPSDELRELINERSELLRKVLYRWSAMTHIAVLDLEELKVVYDIGSTHAASLTKDYLWLPILEAEDADLDNIQICPFRYERL